METPKHHILLCGSFRLKGEPKGICFKRGSAQFIPYLEEELSDRGMNEVVISTTGCLNVCDRGPAMVIYPENYWYVGVESEEVVDSILDALEQGKAAEEHLAT